MMVSWTERARVFLKTAPPPTAETAETPLSAVSAVRPPAVFEKSKAATDIGDPAKKANTDNITMLSAPAANDGDDLAEREAFDERAGILEFDAGLPRDEAERLAAAITTPESAAALPARSCTGCTHLTRRKTCAEPVAAGLAESFGICWPASGHALTCAAFSPMPPAPAQERPHRLTPAEAEHAHVEQWDDAACARFAARVIRLLRLGFGGADADDLAERARLLDVQEVGRAMCVTCQHLAGHAAAGWRCREHRAAQVRAELPGELIMTAQRCPAFKEAT